MVTEGDNGRLLSVAEAAEWLGLTARGFERARRRRPCACYRIGRPMFKTEDLVAWREGFREEPLAVSAPAKRRPTRRSRIVEVLNSLDSRATRDQNGGENGTLRPIAGKEKRWDA